MIWHSTDREQVINYLGTDIKTGLTNSQVKNRLEDDGENFVTVERNGFINILKNQIKKFPLIFLIASVLIYTVVGTGTRGFNVAEPIFIILLCALRVFVNTYIIHHSENTLNKLNKMHSPVCKVLRNGQVTQISASNVVVGDILILSDGDYITADARLIETINLHCDEAVLRGDTIDIQKDANAMPAEIAKLSERNNMVYAGCYVTSGQAVAIVTETGNYTELAKRKTLSEKNDGIDPIKEKLTVYYKKFELAVFCVCAVTYILSVLLKMHSPDITFTALITQRLVEVASIAATVIPELLLSLTGISIALSVQRMLKKNALLKNAQAIKSLSNIEVICSDKTGIFTTNAMTVTAAYNGEEVVVLNNRTKNVDLKTANALRLASLCCETNNEIADPTQNALTEACEQYLKLPKNDLEALYPRITQIPFDATRKLMTTVNMIDGINYAIVKGAPEALLPLCANCPAQTVNEIVEQMSKDALRVIAVALKPLDEAPSNPTSEELECNLTFVGLLGLSDKIRTDTKSAIALCNASNIKTVMITGDNIVNACAMAIKLGIYSESSTAITAEQLNKLTDEELKNHIENVSVFAAVSPEDKLRIVSAYQALGKTVAVTGDSSLDTHSMITADVSFAKGINGNDVAKGASDLIMTDDSFSTITEATKQARSIFVNICNTARHVITSGTSKLVFCLLGTLFFATVPFTALQILWLFIIANMPVALALCADSPSNNVLKSAAKNDAYSLFDKSFIINTTWQSIAIAAAGLISMAVVNSTSAFFSLCIAYLLLALKTKTNGSIFKADYKSAKTVLSTALICVIVSFLTVCTGIGTLFGFKTLNSVQFILSFAFGLIPTVINECLHLYFKLKK